MAHGRGSPYNLPHIVVPPHIITVLQTGLNPFFGMTDTEKYYSNLIKQLGNKKELPMYGHLEWLKLLLYVEQYYNEEEFKLYSVHPPLVSLDVEKKIFKVSMPYLNKNHPLIKIGDFIFINNNQLTICEIRDDFVFAKISLGRKIDWFFLDHTLRVEFKFNTYSLRCQHYAIDTILKWAWRESFLHPIQKQIIPNKKNKKKVQKWFNLSVEKNKQQKQAVMNIINKTAGNVPYILIGPPGTGKTVTIVETVLQIYKFNDSSSKILICTPTNNAADEITKRLISSDDTQSINLLRYYSNSRDYSCIDDKIKPYANIVNELGRCIPNNVVSTRQIIICTLTTSIRLRLRLQLPSTYFSYIFIDEASQATEPETLIPFLLLSSNSTPNNYTQVVLCGDPKQLGPVVRSKFVGHLLEISMMERLMKLEIYRKENSNYITNLVCNFRNHPKILKVPNELFYNNKLLACDKSDIILTQNWDQLLNKQFPIIFHAVSGNEYCHEGCPSVYNPHEIQIVLDYLQKLTQGLPQFSSERIGIVTPYSLQADCIKRCLEFHGISGIHVGTVQVYQGEEKDIIILSTVRTRLLRWENGYHIGFISNPKRINVSLTRAKHLLIVVGNPHVLKYDKNWKHFLSYCVKNNACQGETFSLTTSHEECLLWCRYPFIFPYSPLNNR